MDAPLKRQRGSVTAALEEQRAGRASAVGRHGAWWEVSHMGHTAKNHIFKLFLGRNLFFFFISMNCRLFKNIYIKYELPKK